MLTRVPNIAHLLIAVWVQWFIFLLFIRQIRSRTQSTLLPYWFASLVLWVIKAIVPAFSSLYLSVRLLSFSFPFISTFSNVRECKALMQESKLSPQKKKSKKKRSVWAGWILWIRGLALPRMERINWLNNLERKKKLEERESWERKGIKDFCFFFFFSLLLFKSISNYTWRRGNVPSGS